MTDPISVILIVGVMELGPFPIHGCSDMCRPYANAEECTSRCNREVPYINETVHQACVRVLKEQGAVSTADARGVRTSNWEFELNGQGIYCAPSGHWP